MITNDINTLTLVIKLGLTVHICMFQNFVETKKSVEIDTVPMVFVHPARHSTASASAASATDNNEAASQC